MSKKQLWSIIMGLILLNIILVIVFVKPSVTTQLANKETVALIGKEEISREQWMQVLEDRYGEEVLEELVNQEVIIQTANKYGVQVNDDEVNREYKVMKAMYGTAEQVSKKSEKEWKEEILSGILLEELLTKDVKITKAEQKQFYKKNKQLYNIPTAYHISRIITAKKSQSEKVIEELNAGSDFAVLAMEKSLDEFTANQGGDMGYISEENDQVEEEYITAAKELKEKNWSQPFKTVEGWVVIYLHEKIVGEQLAYKTVQNEIRRQLALEQIQTSVSGKMFWDELEVEWIYEK